MSSGGGGRQDPFGTQSKRAAATRHGANETESTEFGTLRAADPSAGAQGPIATTGSEPLAALDLSGLNRYDETVEAPAPSFDPLRLCVFTTVALIACLLGPIAVLGFALIAIAGYARARRQGLLRSKCKLGDTRLVLAYLSVLAVLAAVATPFWVMFWIGRF